MVRAKKNNLFCSLLLVVLILSFGTVGCATAADSGSNAKARVNAIKYGTSGQGRDLTCIKIQPSVTENRKVLVVFEIHGWEDSYDRDGQVLVDIGNRLARYFQENPEKLGKTALYIVPSANPDGLAEGWTKDGPGRCQISKGVDINRDFDYYWIPILSSRYRTLYPYSAPETRALRDLVKDIKPDDVIDIHGWGGYLKGTTSLISSFERSIGIKKAINWNGSLGEFYAWAKKYATRTALVELPDPAVDPQVVIDAFVDICTNN